MQFLSNDKFITAGLRFIGAILAILSLISLGMWLYAMFFDSLEELERQDMSNSLIGFVGFGSIGFFLLAIARLIEIGQKIADKK